MARKRMIDPSFWIDEKLGSLQPVVRLLFMGLISQADDEGRLNGHPSLLKSLIFPYDHDMQVDDVDSWLTLLASNERKLIVRYEIDHQKYVLITNFKKHQTINKPQKSKLPDYYGSSAVVVSDDSVPKEVKGSEEKGKEDEEKGREEQSIPTQELLDSIHALLKQYKVENFTAYSIEILASYIGVVEREVIDIAIKKAESKHVNYAIKTINGWIKEGKTTKQQVMPTPSSIHGKGKPKIPIYKDDNPDEPLSEEELEEVKKRMRNFGNDQLGA